MRDESRLFEYVAFFRLSMRDENRILESVGIFEDQCETKTGFWNMPHFSRINARQKQIIQIFEGMDDPE